MADREPKPVEYQEGGIRHRLIIQRANDLLKAGVPVIEVNLYDQVDGIHGESIVVAGAIEDNCVLARAKFLQAQGVGQVIIDLALTANFNLLKTSTHKRSGFQDGFRAVNFQVI